MSSWQARSRLCSIARAKWAWRGQTRRVSDSSWETGATYGTSPESGQTAKASTWIENCGGLCPRDFGSVAILQGTDARHQFWRRRRDATVSTQCSRLFKLWATRVVKPSWHHGSSLTRRIPKTFKPRLHDDDNDVEALPSRRHSGLSRPSFPQLT